MRLFFVRHGETVDNVAGLYAGSRDSALTNHGVLQAQRLASHLADTVFATHVFSSNLERAVKTAEAVCTAQADLGRPPTDALRVVRCVELREKHFGTGEGTKFGAAARAEDKREHVGAETPEQMRVRVNRFLDNHLAPLLLGERQTPDIGITPCVIVVAHGIILGVLYRALCGRFSPGGISIAPEARSAHGSTGSPVSALSPVWSNTGYLEATISGAPATPVNGSNQANGSWQAFRLRVERVNCTDHLKGLKKTRGGIGSARFDEKQRKMDSFFGVASKKRKLDDAAEPKESTTKKVSI